MVPEEMKRDISVICRAAQDALNGLPISSRKSFPPLSALTFYMDAARAKYCWQNRKFQLIREAERGVACVGGEEIESL